MIQGLHSREPLGWLIGGATIGQMIAATGSPATWQSISNAKLYWDDVNGKLLLGPIGGLRLAITGESQFAGTTNISVFNYSTTESTYIRGGKDTSSVYVNDSQSGIVQISNPSGWVGVKTSAGNVAHGLVIRGGSSFGLYVIDTTEVYENFSVSEAGNVYIRANCSASTFTDRTKYPTSLKQATDALISIEGKGGVVDHDKLDPFIKGSPAVDATGKETPTRDIGATLSCLVEAVKDLMDRVAILEKV
jgi:hypothetical protein